MDQGANIKDILVCRICLTILEDQHLEITSTSFEDKNLIQLMELMGGVSVCLLIYKKNKIKFFIIAEFFR